MRSRSYFFSLLLLLALVVQTTGCSKKLSNASSDDKFAEMLAEAFRKGDMESFEELSNPETPKALVQKMREIVKPSFGFKPDTVSHSLTTLSKVDVDLPGTIDGRKLVYTTAVDGVVHLVGKFQTERGEGSVELYIPFQRSKGGYHMPAFDYAANTPTAEQRPDGKPPESPQPPR